MQTSPTDKDEPEDRSATRLAIVTAARAVAERDGVESLTLSKVAVEAGLPRGAVYRQFTRKEDLLMSIVSDDLASLARNMRGIDWQAGGETPESAIVVPLQRAAEPEPVAAPAEVADLAKDVSAALEAAQPSERRLTRRADLLRVLNVAPEAKDETPAGETADKPAPRADAWLERRLRVFERGMAAMETRQEQVEKNARAVVAAAEDSIKALEARVHDLTVRADAAEARHKAAASEMRAALNEATLRIQTVEGVARAALAENVPGEMPVRLPEAVAAPEPAEAKIDEIDEPKPAEEPTPDAPKSVIAEVRKSVAAASAAAAAEAEVKLAAQAAKARRDRTRYLVSGLIMLAVFVAAAGMAFSKGVADGRRDAMHHIVRIVPRKALATAAATPLDRLSARAEAGDPPAEYAVATRYLHGTDTAGNPAEAMRWLTLAAAHGLPAAQYKLGTLYARGVGAPADAGKALQWYEAAALQGNRKAMHDLAVAYAQGSGTARNLPEAVRWFSRAAGLGYVDSQFNLAVLYERGDGVPQSLLDAYKWYLVASRQGDAEARQRIEALRTQLNADDLAAAQQAADSFRAVPYDVAANTAPQG